MAERPEGAQGGGAGAADALDARFEPFAADLRRLCRQLLGDPEAAGEALSEVYLRARQGFDSYDRDRPLRPWLMAVAAHHCIDRMRRTAREQRLFLPEPADEASLEAPGPSPLGRLLGAEAHARLAAAVEALPPRYRAPLVLRYHLDLSYEEIAARLGTSRGQVGTLLLRGRRLLRRALEPGGGAP